MVNIDPNNLKFEYRSFTTNESIKTTEYVEELSGKKKYQNKNLFAIEKNPEE